MLIRAFCSAHSIYLLHMADNVGGIATFISSSFFPVFYNLELAASPSVFALQIEFFTSITKNRFYFTRWSLSIALRSYDYKWEP